MKILKYQCDICKSVIDLKELCALRFLSYLNIEDLELCENCCIQIKNYVNKLKNKTDNEVSIKLCFENIPIKKEKK